MLKKRILASSMASVMALSGVSVAAFADETKNDYGEAVTRDELEKYVKSFDKFLEGDILDYGSVQGEDFQDAIDHANAVLDDSDSKAADFSAAYQMVKAVYDALEIKSASDLQSLIKKWQADYDSNNIMNEELQDNIYGENSYADFETAFSDAERYVTSGDSRIITDAWFELDRAGKALEPLDKVTKSAFRDAIKKYEKRREEVRNYEDWRRGKVTVKFTDDTEPDANACGDRKSLADSKVLYVTYGDLVNITMGASDAVISIEDGKFFNDGDEDATPPVAPDGIGDKKWLSVGATDATVYGFVTEKYKYFDSIKASRETTDEDIVKAYNTAVEAIAVFDSWERDDTDRSSKAAIANLIKGNGKYHNQMACQFVDDDIQTAIGEIEDLGTAFETNVDYQEKKKLTCKKGIVIPVNKETGKWNLAAGTKVADNVDNLGSVASTDKAQKISAGTDILQYIAVTADDVKAYYDTIDNYSFSAVAGGTDVDDDLSDAQTAYNSAVSANNTAKGEMTADTQAEFATLKEALTDAITTFNGDGTGGKALVAGDASTSAITVSFTVGGTDYDYTTQEITGTISTGTNWAGNEDATVKGKLDALNTAIKEYDDVYKTGGTQEAEEDALDIYNQAKAQKALSVLADDTNGTALIYNLYVALDAYEDYLKLDFKKDDDKASGLQIISALDTWNQISKANGSTAEWTLIYRKVLYALNDLYPEGDAEHTLSELRKLIDDSYDLAELTGDAALFATPHGKLVDLRQDALDWWTVARKTKGYKDGDKIEGGAWTGASAANVTTVYDALDSKYSDLKKWYNDFLYSYGDMKDKIGEIALAIDNGDVKATDDLKKALATVAYNLSIHEASEVKDEGDINQPFDDERVLDVNNRLKTDKNKGGNQNDFEKDLEKYYDSLIKAYDAAKGGATGEGFDFDGDDKLSMGDVTAILEAYLASSTETAKYDYDGNGEFTLDDVTKMLEAYLAV